MNDNQVSLIACPLGLVNLLFWLHGGEKHRSDCWRCCFFISRRSLQRWLLGIDVLISRMPAVTLFFCYFCCFQPCLVGLPSVYWRGAAALFHASLVIECSRCDHLCRLIRAAGCTWIPRAFPRPQRVA